MIKKIILDCIKLEDIYNVKDGISTGFKPFPELLLGYKIKDTFTSLNGKSEKFNPNIHKKVIDGGEFNKFTAIYWKGRYIKYEKSIEQNPKPLIGRPFNCQLREKDIFESCPKILSRQTSDKLIMTIDDNRYYTRNSIHNIYPKYNQKGLEIKYILSLLNSKLMNFVYIMTTQETGKVHPQVHISDIKKLPIKITTDNLRFIDIVDKILDITKDDDYLQNLSKQAKVKEYEKQIDQMVYELYDLTPEEIEIIENFNKK